MQHEVEELGIWRAFLHLKHPQVLLLQCVGRKENLEPQVLTLISTMDSGKLWFTGPLGLNLAHFLFPF